MIYNLSCFPHSFRVVGLGDGAVAFSPGHPTDFDKSTVRIGCACSRCGTALLGSLLSFLFLYSSISEKLDTD